MTAHRVLVMGFALWLAAQVVGGVQLVTPGDPLATVGTVLVVALLLGLLQSLSQGPRRLLALAVQRLSIPFALIAAVAFNAALFWLAATLASAVGLQYTVDGFRSALLGSLVVVAVGWLVRAVRPGVG